MGLHASATGSYCPPPVPMAVPKTSSLFPPQNRARVPVQNANGRGRHEGAPIVAIVVLAFCAGSKIAPGALTCPPHRIAFDPVEVIACAKRALGAPASVVAVH